MARSITITVSDRLEALLTRQAEARGFATLDECAQAILDQAAALANFPRMPETAEQLETLLLKAMDGPKRTFTDADWERRKQDLLDRHRRSKAG